MVYTANTVMSWLPVQKTRDRGEARSQRTPSPDSVHLHAQLSQAPDKAHLGHLTALLTLAQAQDGNQFIDQSTACSIPIH